MEGMDDVMHVVSAVRDRLLGDGGLEQASPEALEYAGNVLKKLLMREEWKNAVLPHEVVACVCALAAVPGGEGACISALGLVGHTASRVACVDALYDLATACISSDNTLTPVLRCYRAALDNLVEVTGESSDAALMLLLDHSISITPSSCPLTIVQSVALPYCVRLLENVVMNAMKLKPFGQRQVALSRIRGRIDVWEAQTLVLVCDELEFRIFEPFAGSSSSRAIALALQTLVEQFISISSLDRPDCKIMSNKIGNIRVLAVKQTTLELIQMYERMGFLYPFIN